MYAKRVGTKSQNFWKKLWKKKKGTFIIYADFKSILVPEDNGKQNSEESYTIQKSWKKKKDTVYNLCRF